MENEKVRRYFISDMLDIPLEQIRSLRMSNPFLWKRRGRYKLGILDVLLVLNDNRKINIELQVKVVKYWDKRAIFYISKMFTEDLLEIHIAELKKRLEGDKQLDDWIRLFNVRT